MIVVTYDFKIDCMLGYILTIDITLEKDILYLILII